MQKKHLTKLKIKTLNKLGIKGNYFNIVKTLCEKPTANIMLSGERLKTFPLRSETRQSCWLLSLSGNIVLELLARAIGKKKKCKASRLERNK